MTPCQWSEQPEIENVLQLQTRLLSRLSDIVNSNGLARQDGERKGVSYSYDSVSDYSTHTRLLCPPPSSSLPSHSMKEGVGCISAQQRLPFVPIVALYIFRNFAESRSCGGRRRICCDFGIQSNVENWRPAWPSNQILLCPHVPQSTLPSRPGHSPPLPTDIKGTTFESAATTTPRALLRKFYVPKHDHSTMSYYKSSRKGRKASL